MNQPSDTPRTDAAVIRPLLGAEYTQAMFARTLERELNEAKQTVILQKQLLRAVFYAAEFYKHDNGYRLNKLMTCSDNGKEVLSELQDRDTWKQRAEAAEQKVMELREALDYYADASSWKLTEGHNLNTLSTSEYGSPYSDLEIADEPTPWGAKGTWMAGKRARKALSSSSPIAAKWVPVEDVKPLLGWLDRFDEVLPDEECRTMKRVFLAKHGDKFNP